MIYNARVISRSSKVSTKKIDANDIENAKEELLKSGLKPLEIKIDWVASILTKFIKKRLSRKEQIGFLEDFVSFINIGLSTEEILNQIEETNLSKKIKQVSRQMVDLIHKGYHLSQTMEDTGMFSALTIKTVRLGETSPSVEPVMKDLINHYKKEDTFYSGIKAVISYPVLLAFFVVFIFCFFCFGVLPKIEDKLEIQYPFIINILLRMAEFTKEHWYIFAGLIVAAIVLLRIAQKKGVGEIIYKSLYTIPVVGKLLKEFILVNIFTNLTILQKSGMPLKTSINNVSETMPYRYIVNKLRQISALLEKGFSISDALSRDSFFPRLISTIIMKGERLGQLQESFQKIAEYYSEKLQRDIQRILEITPKIMIALVGAFLLTMILGILGPVYQKISQAQLY